MTDLRKLSDPAGRVETGIVRVGDDWPAVFIRGDDALSYSLDIEECLLELPSHMSAALALRSLLELLRSADTHENAPTTELRRE